MFQWSRSKYSRAALNIIEPYSPLPLQPGYGFRRGLKVTPCGATTLPPRAMRLSVLQTHQPGYGTDRATMPSGASPGSRAVARYLVSSLALCRAE